METCDFAGSKDKIVYCRMQAAQKCDELSDVNSCKGKCSMMGNICECKFYKCNKT